MRLILFFSLIISGILVVFYFSWLPQPDFRTLWYIPGWLARWSNSHDTLRTAIPFIFLGLISGYKLAGTHSPWYWWLISWIMFIFIATIAEAGQLLIPTRVFDWRDIAWGCMGSMSGLITGAFFSFFLK